MILTSSGFIFPLITIPYASRVLSPSGMGAVAFAQSIAYYFSLVALLGVQYYGVRICAEVRDEPIELSKRVKELLVILTISTAIASLLYIVCISLVPKMENERFLFLEFLVSIWLTNFGVEWLYQALEQYGYITIRSVLFKAIALVVMFLFVKQQDDYHIYAITVILAGGASNILNVLRLRKLIDFSTRQKLDIRRHIQSMKWFTLASIASGMYSQVDIVLLGFLGTPDMVGLYQLVSKIKTVLISCVNAVGSVLLPRLSYYSKQEKTKQANELIAKTLNFAMLIGIAFIALLMICSKQIVLVMGGAAFIDSARPLMLIGPAVMFSAMNQVLANYMMAQDMEKTWAIVNVIGLASACIANLTLIPTLGITGSAISITFCEALIFAMRCWICRALISQITGYIDPVRIVLSGVVALIGCWPLMHTPISNILLALLFNSFSFLILYFILLVLIKEKLTMDFVQQLFKTQKRRSKGTD